MPARSNRRRRSQGFTLSELLLVFTIVALITLVAYPAMRTFMGYNDDASAATRVTRTYNRVVDQARRRNRAYVVDFSVFLAGEPGGMMTISESRYPSCTETAGALRDGDTLTRIEGIPFGGTVVEDYEGPVEAEAGLSTWQTAAGAGNGTLRLCVSPDGASYRVIDEDVEAVTDGLALRVQRFEKSENGWGRMGPGRRVRFTFGDGAQMELQ